VGLPKDDQVKPPKGSRFSLWGCLPVSSFGNQGFYFYSLAYPNPEPSGGIHGRHLPEGADMKAPREIGFSLWRFLYFNNS